MKRLKRLRKAAEKMYRITCEGTVSQEYYIEDANSEEEAKEKAFDLFLKDLNDTYFKYKDLKVV